MSNRRRPRSARGRRTRNAVHWSEAPELLARVTAPLFEGVETCGHLTDALTPSGTEAGWAPIVCPRVLCLACMRDFNSIFAQLVRAGHELHRCDGCGRETELQRMYSGRLEALSLNVYGFACLGCSIEFAAAPEGGES